MSVEKVTYKAFLEDHLSPGFRKAEKTGTTTFSRLDRSQERFHQKTNKLSGGMGNLGSSIMKVGIAAGGVFAVSKLVGYASKLTEITAKYERFDAILTNTLGTRAASRGAFGMIEKFASKTPFQVDELIGSFVKLSNQGFVPTMRDMRNLGDLGASTGKSFDQLTEAIIDAQTGEFERLKEFGIRASKQGDKVTFTFKGQQKQVDFTADSIRQYILSLGQAKGVSGAMDKISKTTGGTISNLKDNVDVLSNSLGQRLSPVTRTFLRTASDVVDTVNDWAKIPLSQTLEEERIEANLLVQKVNDVNTSEEDRRKILTQLAEIQPGIVDGIDAENIATEKLAENLRKYNDEQIKAIVIQKKKEEQEKWEKKADKHQVKAQQEIWDVQKKAFEVVEAIKAKDKATGSFVESVFLGMYNDPKSRENLTDSQKRFINQTGMDTDKSSKGQELAKLKAVFEGARATGTYSEVNKRNFDIHSYLKNMAYTERYKGRAAGISNEVAMMKKMWGISDDASTGDGGGGTSGFGGDGGSGTGDIGLGSVKGDNRKVTNLTINIEKQVEKIEIREQWQQGGKQQFVNELRDLLLTIVNDTNYIVN